MPGPQPPPSPKSGHGIDLNALALTDLGNAEAFVAEHGHHIRFDHRRHRFLVFGGHWWRPDDDNLVVRLAMKTVRRRYRAAEAIDDTKLKSQVAGWAVASESRNRLEALLSLARALSPVADSGERWDDDDLLLGVDNGVVDLRTGELRPGDPGDRISMHSPIAYDPQAPCPRWEAFNNEVFDDNAELVHWVHKALGYSASGCMGEERAFAPWGRGWNGKSTMLRFVRKVLGSYAFNTPAATFEHTSPGSIPNDLAALAGKRFVTAAETGERAKLAEGRIKAIVGRDAMSARFLHAEFFTYTPRCKLWLAFNSLPRVDDDSLGFWRKIYLVPFRVSFEDRADPYLDDVLDAELPGILTWLVEGAKEWCRRGLEPAPDCVLIATDNYRAEQDPLVDFLASRCIEDPQAITPVSDLYRAYLRWANDEGMTDKERLRSRSFGRKMAQRFTGGRDHPNGRFYIGVALAQRGGEGSDGRPLL